MSLAQAILEYINNKIGCKTLFSTHYHELTDLENTLDKLVNKHVSAEEKDGETSFLTEISQNTKVSELEIETNGNIEIQKGEMQLKEGDLMGTGCVLKITIGKEIKEYTLVITGDLTGDGLSDDRDLLKMARYGVGLDKNLKGAYLKAANVVKDNSPADDRDLLKMSRALVGLDSL